MSTLSDATLAGFLQKKGQHVKLFRSRYFKLRGNYLYYFKEETDIRPRGVIPLKDATITMCEKKENQLEISGTHLPRTYELLAQDVHDCRKWADELKKATNCAT